MYDIYDLSTHLLPLIQAISVNVYQTGWRLDPVVDLANEEKAKTSIREALEYELAGGDFEADVDETELDKEVEEEFERIKKRAPREAQFLRAFFNRCCPSPDMSYLKLLKKTGDDQEITGQGYWEVLRDSQGRPARFIWSPARYIRVLRTQPDLVSFSTRAKKSDIHWENVPQQTYFRQYGQIANGKILNRFKQYGDPRVMSRATGRYYKTLEDMYNAPEEWPTGKREEGDPLPYPATELLQFDVPYAGSSHYGKPEWAGAYPSLCGGRDLDEENMRVVADEAIPSMLLLCAGGRVDDRARIEDQLQNRPKGRKQVQIINAYNPPNMPSGPSATPTLKVEFTKPLQTTDALFLNYAKYVRDETRATVRAPKAAVGDDQGINRATWLASRRFFEEQVCAPRRTLHLDEVLNTTIIPDLYIECWAYCSRPRPPTDPEVISETVNKLMNAGVLTPVEAREIVGPIYNKEFDDLPGIWAKLTTKIVTTILQTKNQAIAAELLGEDIGVLQDVANILRNAMEGDAAAETQRKQEQEDKLAGRVKGDEEDEPEGDSKSKEDDS
jgi:capsid portal protein